MICAQPSGARLGLVGSQTVSRQWNLIGSESSEGHPRRLGWMGFREGFLVEVTSELSQEQLHDSGSENPLKFCALSIYFASL